MSPEESCYQAIGKLHSQETKGESLVPESSITTNTTFLGSTRKKLTAIQGSHIPPETGTRLLSGMF